LLLQSTPKDKDESVIMNRIQIGLSLAVGGFVAAVAVVSWAQDSKDTLLIEQPVVQDVYAARRDVNVRATIDGDLVAAGQRVTVDGNVTGDIIVAAQDIEIRAKVNDDLRAAGQHIRVTSPVAGHIVAAGQSITISENVGNWAWLAGDTVEVLGDVGGDLRIRARKITIDAEVDGHAQLIGDELRLGPEANVRGDLRWRSENEADISPEAIIGGEFIEEPLPDFAEEIGTGGGLSFTLSVIVAVMVLFLLFSRPLRASADRIATHPVVSFALGFAVLTGMPVLALILIFTPLNAWFGLAVLGIYLVMLFLSVLTGLFAVSDLALRRFRSQPAAWQALAAIFFTVVVVGILAQVPYLGIIAVLTIWLLGVGALCWGTWVGLHNYEVDKLPQS